MQELLKKKNRERHHYFDHREKIVSKTSSNNVVFFCCCKPCFNTNSLWGVEVAARYAKANMGQLTDITHDATKMG